MTGKPCQSPQGVAHTECKESIKKDAEEKEHLEMIKEIIRKSPKVVWGSGYASTIEIQSEPRAV
jgi:hypothetical protein